MFQVKRFADLDLAKSVGEFLDFFSLDGALAGLQGGTVMSLRARVRR
jgi:hypothetical protein